MQSVPERAVCDSTIEDKDMKYRKINDTTVQCIISGEDMTEYGLALSDILERSQKGEEFLRDIIERAHEEVGYERIMGCRSRLRRTVRQRSRMCWSTSRRFCRESGPRCRSLDRKNRKEADRPWPESRRSRRIGQPG